MARVNLSYAPTDGEVTVKGGSLTRMGLNLVRAINGLIDRTGGVTGAAMGPLQTYTVTTLPDPSAYPRSLIYVSNETGGATIAFSDSVNWRRLQDRAIVS